VRNKGNKKRGHAYFSAPLLSGAAFDPLIARMARAENEALSEKRLIEHQITISTTLSFS
jgi:hypothetical protein